MVEENRKTDRNDYFASYRKNNSEQLRKYNNDYYEKNKKVIRLRQKAYYWKLKAEKQEREF